ncbi:circularly permuted type 2 ATP-grasp protein [Wenxinia marina]|uniref:Uncharacterized protein n=1 Tax=Wenxinia marina DSM 24838 TaxID=1123501 RepID=A0A0D0QJX8_9RHOB|nr:circularly permuted type 2 ATP-grasp protein [Wenxinia marina]KIQ71313.1 hypothetical protein Wenmar_00082 [Wenxinia marina DSM 24838]GGL73821.1 hypothetical protein GCM10011392_30410 [Wenxinia marina]
MPDPAARALPDLSALLTGYRPPRGVADELLRPDGSVRPVWRPLLELLAGESADGLRQRFARGEQYLRDAGVYFRQYGTGAATATDRDWPLSPLPVMISSEEWMRLSDGIAQRADLLERVMADLYGEGRLVSDGYLPAELVAGNPEWLRPLVGIRPRSGHHLHFLAFEIGRSPDGSWFVLGDRAQAPSGAGFALENRMATSRVFPDLFPAANVERLAGFFRAFRDGLNDLRDDTGGRVAILTPGQHTDTYYEHAYIARYLGFMLLEGADLTVSDGRLAVQTINRPEPISVVWRRLDSRFCDPLELDEGSTLGTPALVSALRSGAVTMANCLGSGVLESRALLAFLPRISERLLGEPLRLPNIATWWCGQPAERQYVRDNLDRMMIGPALTTRLPFDGEATTILGGKVRGGATGSIGDWLEAEGARLVGQESVTLSTTPAMEDGRLVPRPMVVRVFAARTRDGWAVMPGGYARIGGGVDPTALALQAGGSVADVWVVSDSAVKTDTLTAAAGDGALRRMPGLLPARAAENLFWLGRYVERVENGVRLLRAYHLRLDEAGRRTGPLLDHLAETLDALGLDPDEPLPEGLLTLFDASRGCAAKVRDRFSVDGWNALNDVAGTARAFAGRIECGDDAARAMSVLLRKLAGFSGLVHENMFRFTGWRFLTMGRALERAAHTAHLLAVFADPDAPDGAMDVAIEVGDSVFAHRRRYAVGTTRETVIDLLALDGGNPRSLMFQADVLAEQERLLPTADAPGQLSEAGRRILRLRTDLAVARPVELDGDRLQEMAAGIAAISDLLTLRHLG